MLYGGLHMKKVPNSATAHAAVVRKTRGRKPHSKTVNGLVITAISLMSVLSLVFIGTGFYILHLFDIIGSDSADDVSYVDSLPDEVDSGYEAIDDYKEIEEGAASVAEIPVRGNTKNIKNYMLIGVDSRRKNFVGLADSNIILTLDSKNKQIKLTSLLRDTLVTIPGRDRNNDGKDDYAKFNASYAYGGFDLLSKTVEQNFRLKIDQYITVNFTAFTETIDKLGGVDIYLTAAEAKWIKVGTTAKVYHLNGGKALAYARIRKLDSDFGRTDRQRKMLTAMFKKAKGMSVGTLNSILNAFLPKVDTNISANELTGFVFNSSTYFSYTMDKTFHLPPNGEYRSAPEFGLGSVLYLKDPAHAVTELHKFIYNG
ncbi:MAG TPA: hypothetical protein DEP23_12565 [Ruminococcaceae bacterium]|nr:hypothetical protein [Oscillospiraceae bacterium]